MQHSPGARLAFACALAMLAFAANSILNRLALTATDIGPASFAAIRLAAGAAMLGALVLRGGGLARLGQGLRWRNALALAAYMLGFSFAYVSLDAGLGALILFGGVQITMFAGSLVSGDAIPRQRWLGAGIAFAGLAWLLWPTGASAPAPGGSALMVLAAIGWGIYSLLGKGGRDPLGTTAGSFLLALVPAALVLLVLPDPVSIAGAGLAILSGAVTSGLGYALWYKVLPKLESSVAAVLQLTVPVLAMAAGVVVLGEDLTLRFVVATALVLGGVAVAVIAPSAPARRS